MRDMEVNDEHYAKTLKELRDSVDFKTDRRVAVKQEDESDIEKGE